MDFLVNYHFIWILANYIGYSPVSWSCRIHWLHLCRGVRLPLPASVLDMTLNYLNCLLLSCPLWPRVVVPVRVPSVAQIELFNHFLYLKPLKCGQRTHHHHVVPQAQISLTLSRHFSLSFITSGRSSGPHPVSSHSCWMYVRAGRRVFAWPYVGVHRNTSLMSSSLLLQLHYSDAN